ncbi:MAG: hypothetical protein ABL917_03165 [Parcubacteria group bacterium]
MTRKFVLIVFTLIVSVITLACGGSPTAPSVVGPSPAPPITLNPGTPPAQNVVPTTMKWSDVPVPYTPEVKQWLIDNNINNYGLVGATDRVVKFPITVLPPSDMSREAVEWAFNQWVSATGGKISFQLVTDPDSADFVSSTAWSEPSASPGEGNGACGYASPGFSTVFPGTLVGGRMFFAHTLKPECKQVDQGLVFAHEIGHLLFARGHFSEVGIMGTSPFPRMTEMMKQAVNVVYSLPPRTVLVD